MSVPCVASLIMEYIWYFSRFKYKHKFKYKTFNSFYSLLKWSRSITDLFYSLEIVGCDKILGWCRIKLSSKWISFHQKKKYHIYTKYDNAHEDCNWFQNKIIICVSATIIELVTVWHEHMHCDRLTLSSRQQYNVFDSREN